ncbi:hypothetical protein KKF84_09500 [Myxococcota bacterium]|nr:hypothetical protein [Myxococcota bacterium]
MKNLVAPLAFSLLSALFFSWGCASTNTYHRSALTPVPQAALHGSGYFRGRSQISLGSAVVSSVKPREGISQTETNPDGETVSFSDGAANWIPRTQANLLYRHKFGQYFAMGLLGELALNPGAVKTYKDTVNLRPRGNAYGMGLTFQFLLPIHSHAHLGIGTDLLIYNVPYAKMATESTSPSSANLWEPEYGTEVVGVGSFYIIPTYIFPWGTVFGGLTIRNHPSAPKVQTETSVLDQSNVDEGKAYYVLSMGAQINLSHNLAVQIMIYQPITNSPVVYYPMGAFGLVWDIDAPRQAGSALDTML